MGKTVRTTSVEPGMTLEAYIWHTPSNRVPHIVKVLSKTGTHPKTGMTIVMDKFTAESDGVSMSTNVDGTMCRVTFKTVGDNEEPVASKAPKTIKPAKKAIEKVSSDVEESESVEEIVSTPRSKKFKIDPTIVLPPPSATNGSTHLIETPNGSIIKLIWERNTWNNAEGHVIDARKIASHGYKYVSEDVEINEGE